MVETIILSPLRQKMHNRIDKINELIRENLSLIIHDFISDNFVSISSVDTSKDFSYSDVSIMVLNDNFSVIDTLNKKSFKIQSMIAQKIQLRKTPKIRFHLDRSEAEAEKIDNLIKEI